MDCSTPGFPVLHCFLEFAQTHVHWVRDPISTISSSSNPSHPHPLFLLPSVFPNIRVFSNESALRIRWPKYLSFSFCLFNEHSGWFPLGLTDLISCSPWDSQVSPAPQFETINPSAFLMIQLTFDVTTGKTQRRRWHPTPVLLPGKSHGRRSLVGCSPWGR